MWLCAMFVATMSADLRRSVDLMLKSAEGTLGYKPAARTSAYGAPIARGYSAADEADGSAYTNAELARQLRTCMREIVELRSELSAERDGRSQLLQLHARRIKEELLVEFHAAQHTNQRDIREIEAAIKQRFAEAEAQHAADRRRVDEATRFAKVHERQQFDVAEEFREAMDEMRGRVDAAVAMCTGARGEAAQELERERAALQHRLDIELMRYSELYRKQQADVEETKRDMAREVEKVNATVGQLVDAAWEQRMRSVTKHVNEALTAHQDTSERLGSQLTAVERQLDDLEKTSRRDLASSTAVTSERLASLEGALPVTTARVERFERRVDALLDSNGKLSAAVDVLREAVDKAGSQASRSSERAQRVEDTMADRDARITAIEAQCVALSGIEAWRSELEAAKRGIARIDHSMDSIKATADRSERLVEATQRSMESSAERSEAADKKVARLASKFESTETRVLSVVDRIVALEEGTQRATDVIERIDAAREALHGKVAAVEGRMASLTERSDASVRDVRDRVATVEAQTEGVDDLAAKVQQLHAEVDRVGKRVNKAESMGFNATENASQLKDQLAALERELGAASRRTQAVERQVVSQAATPTGPAGVSSDELAGAVANVERKLTAAIDTTARAAKAQAATVDARVDALHTELRGVRDVAEASRHHVPPPVVQPAHVTAAGPTSAEIDGLRTDVNGVRRAVQALESANVNLETRAQSADAKAATLSTRVGALAGTLDEVKHHTSLIDQRVATLEARPPAESAAPAATSAARAPEPTPKLSPDAVRTEVPTADVPTGHSFNPDGDAMSPTYRSTFTIDSGRRSESSDPGTDDRTQPGTTRPPLAPAAAVATTMSAPAVPAFRAPAADPYASETDSMASDAVQRPRRDLYTSSENDSSPDATVLTRARPQTDDPFQNSPSASEGDARGASDDERATRAAGAGRGAGDHFADSQTPPAKPAARPVATFDTSPSTEGGDDTPHTTDRRAAPRDYHTETKRLAEEERARVVAVDDDDAEDDGIDDAVSAASKVSTLQPASQGRQSTSSSKKTTDMTLSLASTAKDKAPSAAASGGAPPPAPKAAAAWDFDADTDEDDDEAGTLDDDDLAAMF